MVKTLTEIIAELEELKRKDSVSVLQVELRPEQLRNILLSLALHVKRLDDNCPGTHQHNAPVTASAGGQDA